MAVRYGVDRVKGYSARTYAEDSVYENNEVKDVKGRSTHSHIPKGNRLLVMQCLHEHPLSTYTELANYTDIDVDIVNNNMTEINMAGWACKVGSRLNAKWELTSKGKEMLVKAVKKNGHSNK